MTYVDRLLTARPDRISAGSKRPPEIVCPEVGPLLSVVFALIGESRSVVVNITSAHAGAGTSTVARKLAEAAAATGWCRVALLDAGGKSAGTAPGLVDAIERGESPALATRRVGAGEIGVGRLRTAGRPLSRIETVRRLYGGLRDRYWLVVVDCPPVFAGQQTLMMAGAADETVLVVEAERTALGDVARARAALEQRGAGVLGMVMNKSRSPIPALFGGRA